MRNINFKIGDGDPKTGLSALPCPVEVGLDAPFFVIAGPCVIESKQLCLDIANKLTAIAGSTGVPIIFKASFDKANRTSLSSFRGPGLEKGLEILSDVRTQTNLPVITDIHEPSQAAVVARVVDCLQIPAFLCRQTDLLCAAAKTGRPVNVKKGQFLSPAEMKNVVEKINACGNTKVMLTERGTFFGYNRLVNDMTAIEAMKNLGCPVIFDATHSTQQPGALENATAGSPQYSSLLAKAAAAAGANALFFEVHPQPERAKSDAGSVIPVDWLEDILKTCKKIFELLRK